nr:MAG TPA: hypothetical protein [Bacteriophage sp.]
MLPFKKQQPSTFGSKFLVSDTLEIFLYPFAFVI